MNNKKKTILPIILILTVMIVLIGVSYAYYNFAKTSTSNSSLVAGDVYMHFNSPNTNIIGNLSMRDDNYYEFSIDGKNTSDRNIVYDINVTRGENTTGRTERLDDRYLVFTLKQENANHEWETIVDNVSYTDLSSNVRMHVDTITSGSNTVLRNYRLYYKLGNGFIVSDTESNATYDEDTWKNEVYASVKVVVTGDFQNKTIEKITLTLNAGSGTVTPSTVEIPKGSLYYGNLPTPTKPGYEFLGWTTDENSTDYITSSTAITNQTNHTLYANYEEIKYTVTLDKQGGVDGTDSVRVAYNSSMPNATAPIKTGYLFGGYFSEVNGSGTEYYTSSMTSAINYDKQEDSILFAKWTLDSVSNVSFTPSEAEIDIDETLQTTLSYKGTARVAYSSSDTSIATVSSTGLITGIGLGETTITVTLTDYGNNETVRTIPVTVRKLVTATTLTEKVNATTGAGTDGLVAVTTDGTLYSGSGNIREYRYSGGESSVKNYITFNGELWRIIGLFDEDGDGTYNMRIVRNDPLSGVPSWINSTETGGKQLNVDTDYWAGMKVSKMYWNSQGTRDNTNDWRYSGIKVYLNEESSTQSWYYANYNVTNGTNQQYERYIDEATWHLGNVWVNSSTYGIQETAASAYTHERSTTICSSGVSSSSQNSNCYVWNGNVASIDAKVGLLYPSDFGYANQTSKWTTKMMGSSDDTAQSTSSTNWILKSTDTSGYYWFISPSSYSSKGVFSWQYNGSIGTSTSVGLNSSAKGGRPVLNLTSNTPIISGTGEYNNPYRIIAQT